MSQNDLRYLENWLTCLKKLMELNQFLVELDEATLAEKKDGGKKNMFPEYPNMKKEPQMDELSVRIAKADFACFYGLICGFQYKGETGKKKKIMNLVHNFPR